MIDILGFLREHQVAPPHLHIVDVGAMMIDANPWDALVHYGAAKVTGFEPQANECARLEANAGPNHATCRTHSATAGGGGFTAATPP